MFVRFTSLKTQRLAGLKPCVGCVVCGGEQVGVGIGNRQAAAHANNPRDPGGPGFM